jgi:hypothetical protein
MRFHTVIQLNGKTATGIQVPSEVVEGLGQGKRPAVRVTVRGYTYRSTVAMTGGAYLLPVSAEVRERAGVAAGDEVDVNIELDSGPREVIVPADFAEAHERDAEAKRLFDGLSYSNKRRLVLSIEEAKSVDTRRRRIDKTVAALHDGKA